MMTNPANTSNLPHSTSSLYNSSTRRCSGIEQRESSYKSTANQACGFIHSEILQFQNVYDINSSPEAKGGRTQFGKWKYEGQKKGVAMFSTASTVSKQPFLLGYTRMKCRPEYLYSYLFLPNSRFSFDNSLKENIELQKLTDKIRLYYASFQTTNCIVTYTVNLCYLAAARTEGSCHIISYSSVTPHPMMRAQSGVSTIWLHYSGFYIQPFICDDGSIESLVYYMYQVDFQRTLPVKVLRFAQDRQMMQLAYIRMIIERCLLSGTFNLFGAAIPEDSINLTKFSSVRQNSYSDDGSQHRILRVPSCSSLASIGSGRRVIHRAQSVTLSGSPPLRINSKIRRSPSAASRSLSSSSRSSFMTDRDPDSSAVLNNLFFYDCSDDDVGDEEEEEELMKSMLVDPEDAIYRNNRGVSESSQGSALSAVSRNSSILGYGNMASVAAGSLFKEYVEIVESVRFSQLHPEKFIWKVIEQKKGVWCMEKSSSATMSICGVTRVDTDEATLLEFIREPQNRVIYDKLANKTYVIEEINDELMIVYTHMKTQYCFFGHDRDICCFSYVTRQGKKTILAMASCTHPACPKEKGIIRSTMYDSGFIIEPLPDEPTKCSLVYVLKVDIGGYLPHSLIWLIKRRQPLILANIVRYFDKLNGGQRENVTLT